MWERGWEGELPMRLGNIDSLSTLLCTHAMRCSTYSGAGILVGRLKFSESCQRYSNLYLISITPTTRTERSTYSSVAFISGQL